MLAYMAVINSSITIPISISLLLPICFLDLLSNKKNDDDFYCVSIQFVIEYLLNS